MIRNLGISLHDPAMQLVFHSHGGPGHAYLPLKRRDEQTGQHSEFARGMIARFALKSYEMDAGSRQMLDDLKDLKKQDATLVIYSQGYVAHEIRLGTFWRKKVWRWNNFAWSINRRFNRQTDRGLKIGNIVPKLDDLHINIRMFIQHMRPEPEPQPEKDGMKTF